MSDDTACQEEDIEPEKAVTRFSLKGMEEFKAQYMSFDLDS